MTVELFQGASSSVVETTYFCVLFSVVAIRLSGSVTSGQQPAKMSYVVRPSRTASVLANQLSTTLPMSSSANGTSQPPRSKPPLRTPCRERDSRSGCHACVEQSRRGSTAHP
jgi:hypothetical protein